MSSASAESAPTDPSNRALRRAVPATLTAAAFSVLAGAWSLTGTAAAYVPAILLPSAIGLPFALPALRLTPLGSTTIGFWLVDLATALLMLAIIATRLSRPTTSRARAFRAGVVAVVLGLLAANLLRSVHLSVVTHVGLGGYVVVVLGGAFVALLWGVLFGLVVGLVHALLDRQQDRQPQG